MNFSTSGEDSWGVKHSERFLAWRKPLRQSIIACASDEFVTPFASFAGRVIMSSGKRLLTAFVALALAGTAAAQFGPVAGRPVVPVFQVNPLLAPQAGNGAGLAGMGQPAAPVGLPAYGGAGRISNVVSSVPLVGPAQSYVPMDPSGGVGGYGGGY